MTSHGTNKKIDTREVFRMREKASFMIEDMQMELFKMEQEQKENL